MDTSNVVIPRPALFIAALGPDAVALVLPIIHHLKSSGMPVETDYTGASLKSQMKKADKSGAPYTLIIGDQEMKSGMAVLRNMQTKEQAEIALKDIHEELKKRTAPAS
jgi:histidyl-tRNA synthetase